MLPGVHVMHASRGRILIEHMRDIRNTYISGDIQESVGSRQLDR